MQVLSQSEIDSLLKNLLKDTSILPDSPNEQKNNPKAPAPVNPTK